MVGPQAIGTRYCVRFDRYVEQAGYIRPAPGSQMEIFDPWDDYVEAGSTPGAQEPPYGSLLNLIQSIQLTPRPGPGRTLTLSADSVKSVTSWCEEHGLFGTLLQRAQMFTLAPRYGPLEDVPDRCAPLLHQYLRTNQGWVTLPRWGVRQGTAGMDSIGTLVPPDRAPESWPRAEVLIQNLHSGEWTMESLSNIAGRYFPDVPQLERKTYSYPQPGSEEFWRLYAEPVDEFLEAAALLLGIVQDLGKLDDTADSKTKAQIALVGLNRLLEPISSAAVLSDSAEVVKSWNTPSLLSAFATMILEDLSEQRLPRTCENCGKIFVTKAYQGRYCSDKCRYAAQKRRYRDRQKQRMTCE